MGSLRATLSPGLCAPGSRDPLPGSRCHRSWEELVRARSCVKDAHPDSMARDPQLLFTQLNIYLEVDGRLNFKVNRVEKLQTVRAEERTFSSLSGEQLLPGCLASARQFYNTHCREQTPASARLQITGGTEEKRGMKALLFPTQCAGQ